MKLQELHHDDSVGIVLTAAARDLAYGTQSHRTFTERRRLSNYARTRWENLPKDAPWENISTWHVLFQNTENMPDDEFDRFRQIDRRLITKVIIVLHSIGVRKHNRIPIIVSYSSDKSRVGASYKSSDDYLKIIRDITLSPEQMIGTIGHEVGHAIYNKLPDEVHDVVRRNSRQIEPFTRYTHPGFVPSGFSEPTFDHDNGNEWFADYVAALAMKSYGLPANAMVADWEPNLDQKQVSRGMKAARQIIGQQQPGKNWGARAARENQKWQWMIKVADEVVNKIPADMTMANTGIDQRIAQQLGGADTSVKQVINQFLSKPGGDLESMSNADRHSFMKAVIGICRARQQ